MKYAFVLLIGTLAVAGCDRRDATQTEAVDAQQMQTAPASAPTDGTSGTMGDPAQQTSPSQTDQYGQPMQDGTQPMQDGTGTTPASGSPTTNSTDVGNPNSSDMPTTDSPTTTSPTGTSPTGTTTDTPATTTPTDSRNPTDSTSPSTNPSPTP